MNKQETNSNHFVLKGLTSILIGIYLFAGSFAIKYIIDSMHSDESFFKDTSSQNIHLYILTIIILVLIAIALTFFLAGKKSAKKLDLNLWNLKTKKLTLGIMLVLTALIILFKQGLINLITPTLLIVYAIFLFIIRNKERKDLIILSILSIALGLLCVFIPTYWYSSLSILAIAHITYGVVVK